MTRFFSCNQVKKSDFFSEIHLKDFPLVSTRFDLFFEGINQIIAFSPIFQAKKHGLEKSEIWVGKSETCVLFMSYSTLDKVSKLVPNLEYLFSFNFQLKKKSDQK